MAEREFMSLGFYALLRVLYSLWTSIIKIHLYNCLRKETPRIAQEELPKVLWRHFSQDRCGESPSTDTPGAHLAMLWVGAVWLFFSVFHGSCTAPAPNLSWHEKYCLWKACGTAALISYDVLVVLQPNSLRRRNLRLCLSLWAVQLFYPKE